MRSIVNSMILSLAVLAVPTARASDAHNDAPATRGTATSWTIPFALAADAQDDSGMSARAFQPRESSATGALALAPDPKDDAGMSARALDASAHGQAAEREQATAVSKTAEPAGACICMR